MKTILFIYNNPLDGSYGGSQRTKKALEGLKDSFIVETYSCIKKNNKYKTLLRNILGYSGSLSRQDEKSIMKIIKEKKIDGVFFDVSLHGCLVKKIKKAFPNVKCIVNYHNCEAKYVGDLFRLKGFLYYPIYKSAFRNENLSKKYADYSIFITEEDKRDIGINNNCCVIPVTLDDEFRDDEIPDNNEKYVLFVGSAQYANIEGAQYIIEQIAPNVNIKFKIVGKGMKREFPGNYNNIEVLDYVESLSEVYINACAFISPLFSGSGAKIKVAEALMYGKMIIGTPLSFFGYNLDGCAYRVCNDASSFIKEINNLDKTKVFYAENREKFISVHTATNNSIYYAKLKELF